MIHEDGIEVWLKPIGTIGQRYEELKIPVKRDCDGRYIQCFIPHHRGKIEIVVKYLPGFDTHGASILHVGIMYKSASASMKNPSMGVAFARHDANEVPGEGVFSSPGGIQMPQDVVNIEKRVRFVLKDDEYDASIRPGCIGVSVQRGDVVSNGESDGTTLNDRNGTFKQLASKFGKKYFFEFRPLSEGRFVRQANRLPAPAPAKGPKMCKCPHRVPARFNLKHDQGKKRDGSVNALQKPEDHAPKVCKDCGHFKEPPKGKKISWRNASKSWEVVDVFAHDEVPPFEEVAEDGRQAVASSSQHGDAHVGDQGDYEELPDLEDLLKWAKDGRLNAGSLVPDVEGPHDNRTLATPPRTPSRKTAARVDLTPIQPHRQPPSTPAARKPPAVESLLPTPLSSSRSCTKRRVASPAPYSSTKRARVQALDLTGDNLDIQSEVEWPVKD